MNILTFAYTPPISSFLRNHLIELSLLLVLCSFPLLSSFCRQCHNVDIIFDILMVNEHTLVHMPLSDRHQILKRAIPQPIEKRIGTYPLLLIIPNIASQAHVSSSILFLSCFLFLHLNTECRSIY